MNEKEKKIIKKVDRVWNNLYHVWKLIEGNESMEPFNADMVKIVHQLMNVQNDMKKHFGEKA